ncbi:MAG: cysteine--tRNA ligase, partial [Ferruginibacter sp.]|nr:cysteine--tRNA ligase [Ferruginibacter sp.]
INGRKMGKSYNNVIKLTELFSGEHPLLSQPFHPMTVRFFILQSHYRSTLDFSNDALAASEKALKRLWEAYAALRKLPETTHSAAKDTELEAKVIGWLNELDEFMDDDFNSAKALANLFEMAPVINSIKDLVISIDSLSSSTLQLMKEKWKIFLEDIFGLQEMNESNNELLQSVMQLLIDIRKEAKAKKDFATSDKIRLQLNAIGVLLKDEKDGGTSWTM